MTDTMNQVPENLDEVVATAVSTGESLWIDTITEGSVVLPTGTYEMSLGTRQLMARYVEAVHQGDIQKALKNLKMTPAQARNWELNLRDAASRWANQQNIGSDPTDRQVDAGNYFASLLNGTKTHDDAEVTRQISRLDPQIRKDLARALLMFETQGQYQRARKRLMSQVPALETRVSSGANETKVFDGEQIPNDEEPF